MESSQVNTISIVADWFSIIGLPLSLIGLGLTLFQSIRSRSAAEIARKAAEKAERSLKQSGNVVAITELLSNMQDIKRIHRNKSWAEALSAYSEAMLAVSTLRSSLQNTPSGYENLMQSISTRLVSMEKQVENYISTGNKEPDGAKLNNSITPLTNRLRELLNIVVTTRGES